jgi:hypothetical protein
MFQLEILIRFFIGIESGGVYVDDLPTIARLYVSNFNRFWSISLQIDPPITNTWACAFSLLYTPTVLCRPFSFLNLLHPSVFIHRPSFLPLDLSSSYFDLWYLTSLTCI